MLKEALVLGVLWCIAHCHSVELQPKIHRATNASQSPIKAKMLKVCAQLSWDDEMDTDRATNTQTNQGYFCVQLSKTLD
jgi:hypothetical protein